MAAIANVSEAHAPDKLHINKNGVLTLYGFGIRVQMQRGHLEIEDGIGAERRRFRLPRVGHGLKRLVLIGSHGFVSLAALRWLADQDAAFVMLERNGKVLCVTGPVRPSDARLRRAQALAAQTGTDVTIARELISQKLAGQERVARDIIHDNAAATEIANHRLLLAETENLDAIRLLESRGAAAYWAAWRDIPVLFPTKDLCRVPEHWLKFGSRKSPLTGSQRLAVNPPNAILNYLYSILEVESRLALAALGLDPGLGVIHMDTPARDSLACDLMEVGRAAVDAYVLRLLQQPLRRDWFFEQRDGNCRLNTSFTARLSETAPVWGRAVAPFAEWIARQLWSANRKNSRNTAPPTRLTQQHRREGRGAPSFSPFERTPRAQKLCRGCGKALRNDRTRCADCAIPSATERLINAAPSGRSVAHTPQARIKEGEKQRQHAKARSLWNSQCRAAELSPGFYSEAIQPFLARLPNSVIASGIGVSRWYAGRIRQGYRPHPRHWKGLARLAFISKH